MDISESTLQTEEILSYYLMFYLSGYGHAAPDKLQELLSLGDWEIAAQREIARRAEPALLEMLNDQFLSAIATGEIKLEQVAQALQQTLAVKQAVR